MLRVNVPSRVLEHTLRVAREIAIRTLFSYSFVLKDTAGLVYAPRIEEKPERLLITITQPFNGLITGTWSTPDTLVFWLDELHLNLAGGRWPFSTPSSSESVDFALKPVDNSFHLTLDQLLAYSNLPSTTGTTWSEPSQRVIDLG